MAKALRPSAKLKDNVATRTTSFCKPGAFTGSTTPMRNSFAMFYKNYRTALRLLK